MKISGIYKITSPTGLIYIGSAKDILKRWSDYKYLNCKKQVKLYNSLMKYGVENHIFEIIAIDKPENILKYEYIIGTLYNVLDREKGLNLKLPKYDSTEFVVSEESREKMRNAQLGKKMSPESIEKTRQANLGRKNSEETLLKMSISAKNRKPITEETRLKLSIAAKNRKSTKFTNNKTLISPR